jgi:hypothetical protein
LKVAGDIGKTMISLRDTQAFNSKLIEFQSAIIDAQQSALAANEERAALVEKVGALEKEVADLKAWDVEKQRYELKEVARAAFAYTLKKTAEPTEAAHWLCAACYQNGKKGILSRIGQNAAIRIDTWKCSLCPAGFVADGGASPSRG